MKKQKLPQFDCKQPTLRKIPYQVNNFAELLVSLQTDMSIVTTGSIGRINY